MTSRKIVGTAIVTVATVWFAAALAPSAAAQTWPQRPVRMILPYLGSTEFAGRWLASRLSPVLGQQVVVDPRLGGTTVGLEAAYLAAWSWRRHVLERRAEVAR